MRISNAKDFWSGLIFLSLGLAGAFLAQDYRMGRAAQMGPGYFPMLIALLLCLIGTISVVRSFLAPSEGAIGNIQWKPIIVVPLSMAAFAFLLRPAGAVVAIGVSALIAASASARFRWELRGLALLAALVVFCIIGFVKGLDVPMPILGTWLGG